MREDQHRQEGEQPQTLAGHGKPDRELRSREGVNMMRMQRRDGWMEGGGEDCEGAKWKAGLLRSMLTRF